MEPTKVNVVVPGEPVSQVHGKDTAPKTSHESSAGQDLSVPQMLVQGITMIKVSASKQKQYVFRIDPDEGQLQWESKRTKIGMAFNRSLMRSVSHDLTPNLQYP